MTLWTEGDCADCERPRALNPAGLCANCEAERADDRRRRLLDLTAEEAEPAILAMTDGEVAVMLAEHEATS
jgi:hypothetical protein